MFCSGILNWNFDNFLSERINENLSINNVGLNLLSLKNVEQIFLQVYFDVWIIFF